MVTLAGSENRSCRLWLSRVAAARGIGRGLCGVAALAMAAACSDLDPGNESYCDVNAGIGEACGTGGSDGRGEPDGWWCLDQTPDPLPPARPGQTVAFAVPAVEWNTRSPLPGMGLVANLCPGLRFACTTPLNQAMGPIPVTSTLGPVTAPFGVGVVPVPEGFDGFIKFDVATPPGTPEADQFISETYYLGGIISGDMTVGQPILMIQKGLQQTILEQSFPGVDAATSQNLAVVAFGVYDCDGKTVPNARIELNVVDQPAAAAVPIPFQLPSNRIPVAQPPGMPLLTDTSGLGGYINVPPGTVQLSAYRANDPQPIGRVTMGAVAGQLSIAPIRPAYVLDADITGAPPIEAPTGG